MHKEKKKYKKSDRRDLLSKEIYMVKVFPNLMRTIHLEIQDIQQTPKKTNIKKTQTRYIIIKLPETSHKEKILKRS